MVGMQRLQAHVKGTISFGQTATAVGHQPYHPLQPSHNPLSTVLVTEHAACRAPCSSRKGAADTAAKVMSDAIKRGGVDSSLIRDPGDDDRLAEDCPPAKLHCSCLHAGTAMGLVQSGCPPLPMLCAGHKQRLAQAAMRTRHKPLQQSITAGVDGGRSSYGARALLTTPRVWLRVLRASKGVVAGRTADQAPL
jgi:hypothetical protein